MDLKPHWRLPQGGKWPYWKWAILRSAGFPYSLLNRLTVSSAAAAADLLLDGERLVTIARERALAAITEMPFTGLDPEARNALIELAKRVRADKLPKQERSIVARLFPDIDGAIARWLEARSESERHHAGYVARLDGDLREARRALRGLVADDRMREAILWQSPSSLLGIDHLVADPNADRSSKTRQREHTAAMYVQRFCAKNDTIGFFGPVTLGSIDNDARAIEFAPQPTLVAKERVYFEHWAINALADRIAEDPDAWMALRPRRLPNIRLEGDNRVRCPIDQHTELPVAYASLLAACDGDTTVEQLCERFAMGGGDGFDSQQDVVDALAELRDQRFVTWRIPLPTSDFECERWLRQEIARFPAETNARWSAILDELEALRSKIERASGSVDRGSALARLTECFEAATGVSASRRGGQTYAARSPVYLDSTRACDLRLGELFLQKIDAPLDLLYQCARWHLANVHRDLRSHWNERYRALADEHGRVDYLRFFTSLDPIEDMVARSQQRVQRAWREILAFSDADRRVERSVTGLADAVRKAFAATSPPWAEARFHSPDLMIAASGPHAIERGDFSVVVGELHISTNTVSYPLFIKLSDQSKDIQAAYAQDAPDFMQPVVARDQMHRAAYFQWDNGRLVEIEYDDTRSTLPRERVVQIADLDVVSDGDERLAVEDTTTGRRFLLENVLDRMIMNSLAQRFRWLDGDHLPRVTVDGVVIVREQWTFAGLDKECAAAGFIGARRWARTYGMPRYFFAKVAEEPKPFFVDLDNPFLVEIFCRLAAKTTRLTVSEMLPGPDELWLSDLDGHRYTSEIRIAVVDPT